MAKNQLDILEEKLKEKGIFYTRTDEQGDVYNGHMTNEFHQISVIGSDYSWDVICHHGSFGYDKGLLEYEDNIEPDVIGYLTADDVMELVYTADYRRGYRDAVKEFKNALTTISKKGKVRCDFGTGD